MSPSPLLWFGKYRVDEITEELVDEYEPSSCARVRCRRARSTRRSAYLRESSIGRSGAAI
jgi:hypothetical protein